MTVRRRKRRRWVGVLLVLALTGALGWRLWPNDNLLARSTRVADTKSWFGGQRFNISIGMHWLSNEDVLFDRFDRDTGLLNKQRTIYRRNVRTGRETRLAGLTASRDDLGGETVDDQRISPDGKWFLCSARWERCELAEVNGSRHYFYTLEDTNHYYPAEYSNPYRSFYWLPDSRHWLESLHWNGVCSRMILHDVEHPKLSTPVPIGKNAELYAQMELLLPGQQAIWTERPAPDDSQSPPILTLQRFTFGPKPAPKQIGKVTAPRNDREFKYALSPQGDRIAWCVSYETSEESDTPFQKWLRRYIAPVLAPLGWKSEIWISRIDGTEMRMLGQMTLPPAPTVEDGNSSGNTTQTVEDVEALPINGQVSVDTSH